MKYYFTTRHTALVIVVAIGVEILSALIGRTYAIARASDLQFFQLLVPLQAVVVVVLALGLSGRSEQLEFAGARDLRLLRLANVLLLSLVGFALSVVGSAISASMGYATGSVGTAASSRALLGLFGVALISSTWTDVRVSILVLVPLALSPIVFDMRRWQIGAQLGFVLADADELSSYGVAAALWLLGTVFYAVLHSERSAPSTNRRALMDARVKSNRLWNRQV